MIAMLAAAAFIPMLGSADLFDWDEINFAEITREMIALGDYLRPHVNFQAFYEKPPLFFWMQAGSMHLFGINAFAARLPNALCGIVTLVTLYLIGRQLFNRRFGLIWALVYFGSLLPHMYFRTGIIDPWFNLLIFIGFYHIIRTSWQEGSSSQSRRVGLAAFAGVSIGLAILTKGPVAYLIPALCVIVYVVLHRFRSPFRIRDVAVATAIAGLVASVWFGLEAALNGPDFVRHFIAYQIELLSTHSAGHEGFPGYHFVVNFVGCFPASIFALPVIFGRRAALPKQRDFRLWMLILLGTVLVLFSIVQSKVVHYSSLAYFPLTFLATLTIHEVWAKKRAWPHWLTVLLAIVGILISVVLIAAPLIGMEPSLLHRWIDDPYVRANLSADAEWSHPHLVIGSIFLLALSASIWFLFRNQLLAACLVLFVTSGVVTSQVMIRFLPKILEYTQGAAIEFYRDIADDDCYVDVLGFKSYAQYFYTRKPVVENRRSYDQQWLLTGDIDKTAYFVTRQPTLDHFLAYQGVELLYAKNGYAFLRRMPE